MRIANAIKGVLEKLSLPWVILGSLTLVTAVLAGLIALDIHTELVQLLRWIDEQGIWAAIIFVVVMALVVVLLLPGIFFTTGAGFVFGVGAGTAYVVVGSTLGAAIAFLLARYLLGDNARSYMLSRQKLHAFSREASRHDFKVVLLTRLIPFFPAKLANYVFGLTDFRFFHYVAATFIGFIPFSLHNVYLGSIAADLASIAAGEIQRTPLQWFFYGLGFAAALAAVVFFNKLAKRSLADFQSEDPESMTNIES